MKLHAWSLALGLVSISACKSSEDTPPVEDTSTIGETAVDDATPDTGIAEDTNTPDTALVDGTVDSMVDAGSDAATDAADSSGDAPVADSGADLGYDPCEIALPCPAASSGTVRFCGSVFDLGDTTRVNGVSASLQVSVYDQLAFASAPTTATPIATFSVDACGRFSSAVTSAGVSRYLVAVDESASATTDAYATTGIAAVTKDTSGRYAGLRAFAMRKTTDAAWSTSAGLSPSLVTRGAYLGIFLDPNKLPEGPFPGAPVAGVQFTKSTVAIPASDYYFSDTAALSRTTVNPAAAVTGANGAGLLLDRSVTEGIVFSGSGGLGAGCAWPLQAAATVPGLMLVQEFVMTSTIGSTCAGGP